MQHDFSSYNLQVYCAFILEHTSTTGRHVSLSFIFYCHYCTFFNPCILYSSKFTRVSSLHFIPIIGHVFPIEVLLL